MCPGADLPSPPDPAPGRTPCDFSLGPGSPCELTLGHAGNHRAMFGFGGMPSRVPDRPAAERARLIDMAVYHERMAELHRESMQEHIDRAYELRLQVGETRTLG